MGRRPWRRAAAWVAGAAVLVLVAAVLARHDGGRTRPLPGPAPAEDGPSPVPPGSGGLPRPARVPVVLEPVAQGLEVPWGLAFAPRGDLFLTERPGRVWWWPRAGRGFGAPRTVAVLPDTAAVGEGGLLGLALHPDFPRDPRVYAYQTYRTGSGLANRVLAFRFDPAAGRLVDRRVILDGIPGHGIHDGGQLAFGPDGRLYVSTGDAGVPEAAQDPRSLAGKILRLGADGRVPPDNPLGPGNPVYSLGHRNPQGLAFDGLGRLYATEHGSRGLDEVNRIVAGGNYGWPRVRGARHGPFVAPVRVFDYLPPGGAACYRGPIPQWRDSLFFGALGFRPGAGRHLHRLRLAADGQTVLEEEVLFQDRFGRIRAVAAGPDGCLYFGTSNRDGRGEPDAADDRLWRLCPRG